MFKTKLFNIQMSFTSSDRDGLLLDSSISALQLIRKAKSYLANLKRFDKISTAF